MLQVSHTKELIGEETKRVRKVSVIREGYDLFFNHIEKMLMKFGKKKWTTSMSENCKSDLRRRSWRKGGWIKDFRMKRENCKINTCPIVVQ